MDARAVVKVEVSVELGDVTERMFTVSVPVHSDPLNETITLSKMGPTIEAIRAKLLEQRREVARTIHELGLEADAATEIPDLSAMTVEEVEAFLDGVDDEATLRAVLATEEQGKDRKGVKEAVVGRFDR